MGKAGNRRPDIIAWKKALAKDKLRHGHVIGNSSVVSKSNSGRHHYDGEHVEKNKHAEALADGLEQDRLTHSSRIASGRIQTRSQRARQGSFANDGGFPGPLARHHLQVAHFVFICDIKACDVC